MDHVADQSTYEKRNEAGRNFERRIEREASAGAFLSQTYFF
jgi:hypothetical protein